MVKRITNQLELKLKKIEQSILVIMKHQDLANYNKEHLKTAFEKIRYVKNMQNNHRIIENQAMGEKIIIL